MLQCGLEILRIRIEYNFTEHLNETAIGVIGEAFVARQFHQSLHRLVINARVEHGVHHAWHRELRTRAHRYEQRIVLRTEFFTRLLLDNLQRRLGLLPNTCRKLFVVVIVGVACLGCDSETRGDR